MSNGHSIGASARPRSAEPANVPPVQGRPSWRLLDPERRIQLVSRAMRAGDGVIDSYPLAL